MNMKVSQCDEDCGEQLSLEAPIKMVRLGGHRSKFEGSCTPYRAKQYLVKNHMYIRITRKKFFNSL